MIYLYYLSFFVYYREKHAKDLQCMLSLHKLMYRFLYYTNR